MSKMMYNDWNSVEGIEDLLLHPDMERSKMFLAEMIREDLLNDSWIEKYYRYEMSWLHMWRELPHHEQLDRIIEMGFGPLSMTTDPTITALKYSKTHSDDDMLTYVDDASAYLTYYRMSLPRWRDQSTIQHWAMLHSCQLMTTFIWDLVHLIDPDGHYYVVWDGAHAYIRKEGNNIIYDILWYSVGIPIFIVEDNSHNSEYYDDPVTFLEEVYFPSTDEKDVAILHYYMGDQS